MQPWAVVLTAVVITVGLVGVIVPVLPGLLLVWGAVGVWGVVEGGTAAYSLVVVASVVAVVAQVLKYVVPGRRLHRAGVPTTTLLLGGLGAFVGFFVVPVVGLLIGFVAGVYLAERRRLSDRLAARTATGQAVRAVGLSILVELTAALLIAAGWLAVLVAG